MTKTFRMVQLFGANVADGTKGANFRFNEIEPLLAKEESIVFDFEGAENMTDSFANAVFGVLAESYSERMEKCVKFVHCTPIVQDFILAALSRRPIRH